MDFHNTRKLPSEINDTIKDECGVSIVEIYIPLVHFIARCVTRINFLRVKLPSQVPDA